MLLPQFSKASLLEEYGMGMQIVAVELAELVGNDAAASIGGLRPDELLDVDARHYRPDTNLVQSEGARLLQEGFDYAFDGRLTYWLDECLDDDLSRWTNRFENLSAFVRRRTWRRTLREVHPNITYCRTPGRIQAGDVELQLRSGGDDYRSHTSVRAGIARWDRGKNDPQLCGQGPQATYPDCKA
jgi:hypothetical protein